MRTSLIITALLAISTILFTNSCSMFCKKGNGEIITETRKLNEFDEIEIDGQATVFLQQGTKPSVAVKIDSNLVEFVKTEVSGMKLKIKETKCIEEITEYEIYITTVNLSRLEVDGSVEVKGENTIKSEKLHIKTISSGEINLNLDVDDLETVTKGSGEVKLAGRAMQLEIELAGAGSLDAFRLQAKEADADVNGAGTCKINVSEEFYGDVSGSGKLYYKGNPKKVKTDVSGSGTIQAK
jgi:hypothetical protein